MNAWLRIVAMALCVLQSAMIMAAELPKVSAGKIERLENFPSRYIKPRNIDVWLPDNYSADKRYHVIYMHDGQMLFDPTSTWNKRAWQVDSSLSRLINEGRIADTIVVGIWNNGEYRHAEYYPEKFLAYLPKAKRDEFTKKALRGKPLADRYLKFLVRELKPAIDKKYATRMERESTLVMGSSMGGLISLYAFSEYPGVFGGAAAISTHWPAIHEANAEFPLAAYNYLQASLPKADGRRLYMDYGTAELDALYPPYQVFVDQIMRGKGYDANTWITREFKDEGHNEDAWAKRFEIPVLFLMGKP